MFSPESGHPLAHRAQMRPLPSLASGVPAWHPGAWALPSTTISAASALTLFAAGAWLLRNETMRRLFRLPYHPSLVAGAAFLLAFSVTLSGRGRPGTAFPRRWALCLSLGTLIAAVLPLARPDLAPEPLLHVLPVAALMAAIVLVPRLFRIAPESRLIQRIAPLTILLVLLAGIPAAWAIGEGAIAFQQRQVDARLRLLNNLREGVTAANRDWSHTKENLAEADQQVQRLRSLSATAVYQPDDDALWTAAAVLGRQRDLIDGYQKLFEGVAGALTNEKAPLLSQVGIAPINSPDGILWREDPVFPKIAAVAEGYHHSLASLLLALAPKPGRSSPPAEVANAYIKPRDAVSAWFKQLRGESLADHWLASLPPTNASELPLANLLRLPLVRGGDVGVASLPQLMTTERSAAKEIADRRDGCSWKEYACRSGGSQPCGRLDCYAYSASAKDGIHHRLDILAYYKPSWEEGQYPKLISLRFVIPTGRGATDYQAEVMRALRGASESMAAGKGLGIRDITGGSEGEKGFEALAGDGRLVFTVHPRKDDDAHPRQDQDVVTVDVDQKKGGPSVREVLRARTAAAPARIE